MTEGFIDRVWRLYAGHEMTVAEIAKVIGCTRVYVHAALHAKKKRL